MVGAGYLPISVTSNVAQAFAISSIVTELAKAF